jgi:TetR/AcrR family transcriptional repressor of nem operon
MTVEVLLDAAEKRIRKCGYNAVSFRDLAVDADIKSASVHYHFPRKEDLGLALVQRYSDRFFAGLEKRATRAEGPRARIRAICDVYRSSLNADGSMCLCGMLGAENASLPPALGAAVAEFFEANMRWIIDALSPRWSMSRREKFAASAVAGLQGAMLMAATLKDAAVFERVVDGIVSGAGD